MYNNQWGGDRGAIDVKRAGGKIDVYNILNDRVLLQLPTKMRVSRSWSTLVLAPLPNFHHTILEFTPELALV